MAEFSEWKAGTPCWADHTTKDLGASNTFYTTLFGWESDDQGVEMGSYTLLRKSGKTVAGNMPSMDPAHPSVWVTYICVKNVDETVDRAVDAGGRVMTGPMDVPDLGRMALFADTAGAVVGIWQPMSFIGAELAGEEGAIVWTELNARDLSSAKAFYAEVFGWEPVGIDMGGFEYTEFQIAGTTVAGMLPLPELAPADVTPSWLIYFGVGDTDLAVATATELGATILLSPVDIPPGRIAVLADPEGATFAIITMQS